MIMADESLIWDQNRDLTSVTNRSKVKSVKEAGRLRKELQRKNQKAAAALAAAQPPPALPPPGCIKLRSPV